MSTQNIGLFKALGAKMDYLSMRQRVISQNIANADTPGYKPQDVKPVNFGSALKKFEGAGAAGGELPPVTLASTNPNHLGAPGVSATGEAQKEKKPYEVAPAGNAVVMEEQLINSNQTQMDYNLVTSLYQKNVRLIQTALGVQG